ncbi:DNA-directed DNA polymerase eta rad30 [Gonapodya sp. JEL0774]|nr:DNA-directed DNA polymerase eta rad30 [Gonapodya sp. JEL0774]
MATNRGPAIHPSLKGLRAIAHIDLDAFYCQVEQNRLGLDPNLAVGVQQWQGLIAVNYPARALGIKRHATVSDALQIAKDKNAQIKFVHVATYAPGETEPRHHDPSSVSAATHKVSLEPYRRASKKVGAKLQFTGAFVFATWDVPGLHLGAQIFQVLSRFTPHLQKASVDEAYLDLTEVANRRITEDVAAGIVEGVEDEGQNVTRGWGDLQLYYASRIAKEVRQAVWNGMNKPNKQVDLALLWQTVLRGSQVTEFMRELPFTKIRMLGGKLGHEVGEQTAKLMPRQYFAEKLSVETAGDLWKFPVAHLQKLFGPQTGAWLHDIVRGVSTEEVKEVIKTKSFMSAKSLRPPISGMTEYRHWFGILATELFVRLQDEWDDNGRWPKTLVISYRTPHLDKSRSHPFPPRSSSFTADALVHRAMDLIKQEDRFKIFPCSRISMQVTGLQGEKGTGDLMKWMKTGQGGQGQGQSDAVSPLRPRQLPTTTRQSHRPPRPPKGLMAFFGSLATPQKVFVGEDVVDGETAAGIDLDAMSPATHPSEVSEHEDALAGSDTEAGSAMAEEVLESMRDEDNFEDEVVVDSVEDAKFEDPSILADTDDEPVALIFGNSELPPSILPAPLANPISDPATYFCDKCGATLAENFRSEHEDYHFALRFSNEERKTAVRAGRVGSAGAGPGGVRSGSVGRGKRKPAAGRGGAGVVGSNKRAKTDASGSGTESGGLRKFFGPI